MSKLTALQQAMRIVEKHAYNLFNVYNADSREFLDEMAKCLELEREQIVDSWENGFSSNQGVSTYGYSDRYQNTAEKFYNETYNGGEQ